MPVIKPTCLRDVKLRANLADVVARTVTLRKAGGSRLKGLCPFHNEKTPSFHVDPDKGLFHCFGCGKSGDAITFVRETEQLSFTEAVEALGKRCGIPIEYEEGSGGPSAEQRSLRQEIFALHEVAAEHFHQAFKAAGATGDFFRGLWTDKRKFTPELAEEFKIGAADADGGGLAAAVLRKRFSDDAVRQCGLFFTRDGALLTPGALKPRFRGRLMIPIRDHQGRVVAFTARQTELTPEDDPAREAKYVNSPETPIFTKGNLLFNLDRARSNVGEGRPFVLVEGQLDALRCWSVGLKTAVAPQGTATTEVQMALLRRYHPQAECFFDSDSAGQKAALRFLPLALKAGVEARFLTLAGAEKLDPDLLFAGCDEARATEIYRGLRRDSAMAFACRATLPDVAGASAEAKARAAQTLFEIILQAESAVARAEFVAETAAHLRLPVAAVQKDFQTFFARAGRLAALRAAGQDEAKPEAGPGHPGHGGSATVTAERHLLLLCLHFEKLGFGPSLAAAFPHEWIDTGHAAGVLLNRFLGEIQHGDWPGRDHLEERGLLETDAERALVAELMFETPVIDDPRKVAADGLRQLRARALEPRLREIELALAAAATDSDIDAISLLKQRTELQRQLRAPIGLPPAL